MAEWECKICGHVYIESAGDPEHGIPPGTPWQDVPADWKCPECGVSKDLYERVS